MLSVQLVDLTEQRQAQRSLEDERDFTAAILDTTNTLIIVLDRLGRVVRFNPAAETLSGYRAADVLGTPVWAIVGPALGDRLHARLGTDRAGVPWTGAHQVEDEWVLPSGERRTVMWSCADLESETADSHMVMSGIDVTEERRAQRLVDQVLAATTGTSIIGTDHAGRHHVLQPRRRTAPRVDRRGGRRPGDPGAVPRPGGARAPRPAGRARPRLRAAGRRRATGPSREAGLELRPQGRRHDHHVADDQRDDQRVRPGGRLPRRRRGRHRAAPRRGHAAGRAGQGA